MTDEQIERTLHFIRQGAQWALSDGIVTWLDDDQPEPTAAEIDAGWVALQEKAAEEAAARLSARARLATMGFSEAEIDVMYPSLMA